NHIYYSKKLFSSFYLAKKDNDLVSIARLNVAVYENKVYVVPNYYIDVIDHWLVKNDDLKWKEVLVDGDSMNWNEVLFEERDKYTNLNSYELLSLKTHKVKRYKLTNLHFPFIKKSRQIQKDDTWLSLDEFKERHKELLGTKIDERMLNEEEILSLYYSFNFSFFTKLKHYYLCFFSKLRFTPPHSNKNKLN
ncbi:hypothetical protein CCANL267_03630, partial [Campylobacter canadensis]|nr:hypothetical protein [Campylobacter canadensis]